MKNFEFLTENEHFAGIDDLLEHPEYQGYGYRYIVKVAPNEECIIVLALCLTKITKNYSLKGKWGRWRVMDLMFSV